LNLFYQPLITEGIHHLEPEESKHAVRVMRRRPGDIIYITDGKGMLYEARILSEDQNQCAFELVRSQHELAVTHDIHLAISPLSHPDRLEWFIEKAVELGVNRISLVLCERTEKRHVKLERLQKIAIGAMKQSQRLTLPNIEGPIAFDAFVSASQADQKFIAFVDSSNPSHLFAQAKKGSAALVCIGPEGDFTGEELKLALNYGFVKVSLGAYRLRTETAGIAACHMLNLVNLS
jgi:16S rRNA (uracil1498-N3)-methyltransferase